MNPKSLIQVTFLVLLALGLLGPRSASAWNPNFSHTSLLSQKEGEALFRSYFSSNSLFAKSPLSRSSAAKFWTPNSTEVAQAQDALWKYTKLNNDAIEPRWDQFQISPHTIFLTSDIQQYAGIAVNGKRYILITGSTAASSIINSSTSVDAQDLGDPRQNQFPLFTDGGSAFHAVYSPLSHRLEYLDFDHFVVEKPALVVD